MKSNPKHIILIFQRVTDYLQYIPILERAFLLYIRAKRTIDVKVPSSLPETYVERSLLSWSLSRWDQNHPQR